MFLLYSLRVLFLYYLPSFLRQLLHYISPCNLLIFFDNTFRRPPLTPILLLIFNYKLDLLFQWIYADLRDYLLELLLLLLNAMSEFSSKCVCLLRCLTKL